MPKQVDGLKFCPTCKTEKPVGDYQRNRAMADGFHNQCRDCANAASRAWRRANPEKKRAQKQSPRSIEWRYSKYGITAERYGQMLAEQDGRCAVCRRATPGRDIWHIDHDHACCNLRMRSCGKCVRGLLCSNCNTALGLLRDDPAAMRRAASYVERAPQA